MIRLLKIKKRHVLSAVILSLGSLIVIYGILFQAALTEDRNHQQIALAILRAEITRKKSVVIGQEPKLLLTKNFSSLDEHLASHNWEKIGQFGAGVIYRNAQFTRDQLLAICGMYSSMYMICDLSDDPYRQ